jgi:hypothetical protein
VGAAGAAAGVAEWLAQRPTCRPFFHGGRETTAFKFAVALGTVFAAAVIFVATTVFAVALAAVLTAAMIFVATTAFAVALAAVFAAAAALVYRPFFDGGEATTAFAVALAAVFAAAVIFVTATAFAVALAAVFAAAMRFAASLIFLAAANAVFAGCYVRRSNRLRRARLSSSRPRRLGLLAVFCRIHATECLIRRTYGSTSKDICRIGCIPALCCQDGRELS